MTYRLVYTATGRPCVDSFEDTGAAVSRACVLFGHGYNHAIALENHDGELVAADDELREVCRRWRTGASQAA